MLQDKAVINAMQDTITALRAELAAVRGELLCLRTCEECKVRYDRASGAKCLCGVSRLESERDEAVKLLRPFAVIGGPDDGTDTPKFHDLEDDVTIYANSGKEITAGDVRRAAALIATHDAARAGRGEGDSPQPVEYEYKHVYEVTSPNDLDNQESPQCPAK